MAKCFVIAEAGVNHNGSIELAKKLVDVAAQAGADAVKFQTFKAKNLVTRSAPKAEYQMRLTRQSESQYEMIENLELKPEAHIELIQYCGKKGIEFLSTPFDIDSIDLLSRELNLPQLKLPSGEITNAPFLLKAAQTKKPIILSTGMTNMGDVEAALGILAYGYLNNGSPKSSRDVAQAYLSSEGRELLRQNVTILHCTTEYPAPFEDVNLRAMETLREAFGLRIGFSDHTSGIAIPIAAVALGAQVIEKHFTLDRSMPGPDHKASLEPNELIAMIAGIRATEVSLGDGVKSPAPSEIKNMAIARKSLVAKKAISKGEVFSEQNLTAKRPGSGISPMMYWDFIGKPAPKAFVEDDLIEL